MALARYKDLCIDAADAALLGRFWAEVLGLEFHRQEGGDVYLTGPTPQHQVWINTVPDLKTCKHRLHLDVNAASIDRIEAAGARVSVGESFAWTVMSDEPRPNTIHGLVIDAKAPKRVAEWWGSTLAAEVVHHPEGYSSVNGIAGAPFDSMDFVPVPESKTVKNRLHIDVTTSWLPELVASGATVVRTRDKSIRWTVMADPEGNEFCAFEVTDGVGNGVTT
jgi:catechol 2,3-dioxygenase-like lactoylglutathione lyase family enzyme